MGKISFWLDLQNLMCKWNRFYTGDNYAKNILSEFADEIPFMQIIAPRSPQKLK